MELKRDEIGEEVRYCWECPECKDWNESTENPDYEEKVICDYCYETFKLID
jgi:hypothetical protein